MAEIGTHAENKSLLSLEWATWIFDRASWLLFGSAACAAIATLAIVWMGIIKEEHWDILREKGRLETERAQAAAAVANEAAGKAHERAAALEVEATNARADLGKANAEIAKAQAAIAEAQKQTAGLEKEAEQARLEQERLKAQLAWRVLPPQVVSRLKAELAAQPSRINIKFVANDTEAQYFAIQFANIFGDAKWQVGMLQVTHAGAVVFGLWLPDTTAAGTAIVRQAFRSSGLGFSTETPPPEGMGFGGQIPDAATLLVGSKPIPK